MSELHSEFKVKGVRLINEDGSEESVNHVVILRKKRQNNAKG